MSKYCVFGDSITNGSGDPEHWGWAGLLRESMEGEDGDDRVYVLGVNSDTTTGLLERLEVEARARKADKIVVAIGINDSRYYGLHDKPETTISVYQENLRRIVKVARSMSCEVTFIGLTRVDESKTMPIPWSPQKFYDTATIGAYDDALREMCKDEGVVYVEVVDILTADELPDGIHPSPEGYLKLYERIRSAI